MMTYDSQRASPMPGTRPYLDHSCFNCGEPRYVMRECFHPHMTNPMQQQIIDIVPASKDHNGRGHPQGSGEKTKEVVANEVMVMFVEE